MSKRQATSQWDSTEEDFVSENEDTDSFKRVSEDEVENRIILKAKRLFGNKGTSETSPFVAFQGFNLPSSSGNPFNFLNSYLHENGADDSKIKMLNVKDTAEDNSTITVNEERKDKELNFTLVRKYTQYTQFQLQNRNVINFQNYYRGCTVAVHNNEKPLYVLNLACSSKAIDESNKESGMFIRGAESNLNIERDNNYDSFKRLNKLTKRTTLSKTNSTTVPIGALRDYNWFSSDGNSFNFGITDTHEHDTILKAIDKMEEGDSARLNKEETEMETTDLRQEETRMELTDMDIKQTSNYRVGENRMFCTVHNSLNEIENRCNTSSSNDVLFKAFVPDFNGLKKDAINIINQFPVSSFDSSSEIRMNERKRLATSVWNTMKEDFEEENEQRTYEPLSEEEFKDRTILKAKRLVVNGETSEISSPVDSNAFNYSSTCKSPFSLLNTENCDRSVAISKDKDENDSDKKDEEINCDFKATDVHGIEDQIPYSLGVNAVESTQLNFSNTSFNDFASNFTDYKNISDEHALTYPDRRDSTFMEKSNSFHSSVITTQEPLVNNANNKNNVYLNFGGDFVKEDATDNETNFKSSTNDNSTLSLGVTKMDTTMSSGLTTNLTEELASETESFQISPAAKTEEESTLEKNPFHLSFDQNTEQTFSSVHSNVFKPFPHTIAFLPFPLRFYLSRIFSSEMS